jgi:UDP-N-acetylmuramoylalanine--D-glutamate ligase
MSMSFSVANQHVVVLGAGRSGRAAAHLLIARGARVTLADVSGIASEHERAVRAAGIRLAIGPHRADLLTSADLVVLSPGVPSEQAAVSAARAAGVPVIGEVELASRWLAGRIVAVTGTKGKSTTTSLTARMLQEGGFEVTAGGNLGTALSEQVALSRPAAIHVVEVSSFQLETTDTFHPWISVLLNLSPDHLDRHSSFEAYAAAKARVFRNQTADDWAIVHADDPAAVSLASGARARRFDFALETRLSDGIGVEDGRVVVRRQARSHPLFPIASVRIPGRHLLGDVLAAAAVGAIAGVPEPAMQRAVERFHGLEHALERVGDARGIRFVNDSKATNVIAARRSIESFEDGVVVIMGGRYKGGAFEDLRETCEQRATAVITIGEASSRIEAALRDVVPVHQAVTMTDAVHRAFALARPGGVVLLAPACSSFDMFEDYADRGRAFKAAAGALIQEEGAAPEGSTVGRGATRGVER